MGQIIQFINNTTDTIVIQGIDASAFKAPFSGSLTCNGANCSISPGEGSAGINDLSSFQLNGGADFAFSATLASTASIYPSSFAGINQANYTAAIKSISNGYTVIIDDTSIVAGTIQFINNTNDSITIKGVAGPLDCQALIVQSPLVCASGVYTLGANQSGSATVGDLAIFDAFVMSSTNFAFDVVLGINLIGADLNAQANTQSKYMGSITESNNQYTITIDALPVNSAMVVINNTQDTILIQGIDQTAFTANSFQGAFSCSGGNCSVAPGSGSAGIAKPAAFEGGFTLNGGADFAFTANLAGTSSQISPSPYGGVNQAGYVAGLQINDKQYTITISPTPAAPTILFINNTLDTITLESSLDSGALTNLTAGLSYNGTSYLQTTGVGSGVIGDITSPFTFSINSLSFTVTLGTSPNISQINGYLSAINSLGNLTTITVQKAAAPPGPGTNLNFTFSGTLTELLFSQPIVKSDYDNFLGLIGNPTSAIATFDTTSSGVTTLNVPSIGVLNTTSPNQMPIKDAGLSGNVILEFSADQLPVVTLFSQNVIPSNLTTEPQPFLFPLDTTGTSSSLQLSGPPNTPITLTSASIDVAAYYTFDLSGPSIPQIASVASFNTGTLSNEGFQFFFVLPTADFQSANPTAVSGSIVITDSNQTNQTITLTIGPSSFSNGIAALEVTGNIYNVNFKSCSGTLNLQGDLEDNFPMITINGTLTSALPEFYYNSALSGTINLTFNT